MPKSGKYQSGPSHVRGSCAIWECFAQFTQFLVVTPAGFPAAVCAAGKPGDFASGIRTLAKLNAFDLVVTVALGSTLATVLLSESVALAEGLLAFALLVALQYAVAWMSVRSPRFGALVKSEPSLLLHRGRFLDGAMRRQRVTREEVVSALRSSGLSRPEDAAAVVLETDGSLSVVKATDGAQEAEVLRGLSRIDAS